MCLRGYEFTLVLMEFNFISNLKAGKWVGNLSTMKNTIWKSIGALLAGFVLVVVISIATDVLLERGGIMKLPFHLNTNGFIIVVILYRTVYGILGSFVTARLAPNRPLLHAMIGGFIGLALSITGAIVMREEGPAYYPIALIILALPTAWVGGKLAIRKSV